MTEAEWNASTNPVAMVRAVLAWDEDRKHRRHGRMHLTQRKQRLLALAHCNDVLNAANDQRTIILPTLRNFADNDHKDDLQAWLDGISKPQIKQDDEIRQVKEMAQLLLAPRKDPIALAARLGAASPPNKNYHHIRDLLSYPPDQETLASQVFQWSDAIKKSASQCYKAPGQTEMTGLAMLLEDLPSPMQYHACFEHCRERQHACGCWVLDLILGKE